MDLDENFLTLFLSASIDSKVSWNAKVNLGVGTKKFKFSIEKSLKNGVHRIPEPKVERFVFLGNFLDNQC